MGSQTARLLNSRTAGQFLRNMTEEGQLTISAHSNLPSRHSVKGCFFFSVRSVISSRSGGRQRLRPPAPQSHQLTSAGVPGRYVPPRDVDLFTQRARRGYSTRSAPED